MLLVGQYGNPQIFSMAAAECTTGMETLACARNHCKSVGEGETKENRSEDDEGVCTCVLACMPLVPMTHAINPHHRLSMGSSSAGAR